MENTNYKQKQKEKLLAPLSYRQNSIAHGKIAEIFGHGNLHVFSRTKSLLFHFLLHLF